MLQDEAGFGRINTPKYCWTGGKRPSVPCHHIREYRYVFGAVDPISGDDCFLVAPQCNTVCMNVFLDTLSKQYQNDEILLICDGAAWHKSGTLVIPPNIHIQHIPPYTPEMNPIAEIPSAEEHLHGQIGTPSRSNRNTLTEKKNTPYISVFI